jgi:hypothetical protein
MVMVRVRVMVMVRVRVRVRSKGARTWIIFIGCFSLYSPPKKCYKIQSEEGIYGKG